MPTLLGGCGLGKIHGTRYDHLMHDHDEEPLNALVQTLLPHSARAKLHRVAHRQHLKPGVLVRVWLLDRLDKEPDA